MSINTTSPAWRRLTATVIGAGAIAFGGVALLAPAANAQPKTEAQTECTQEGDEYSSSTSNGHTTEKCCYEGMLGVWHCDVWVDGVWDGGQSFHEQPPTPPITPAGPPLVKNPALAPAEQITPSKPLVPRVPGQAVVVKK
jgi:hypothetical protein